MPAIFDVLIIGAGPAGLEAALVLGRQQRRVCVVDDGHPRSAPVTEFHMYLGRDGGRPADLRRDARREVEAHPNVTFISGRAGEVTGSAGNFTAAVGDQKVQAACVLIATGVVDQLPEIPGLAERWGQQVGHCAYCDGFEALGRTVAVVALDPMDAILARYLADRFSDRMVLHAGKIQDATDALALARDGGVEVTDLMVTGFSGEDPVELALSDGSTSTAEAVFVRPPTVLGSDLGEQLSCELTDDGLVAVSATQQTSVDGVFAAGDGARLRDAPAPVQFVLAGAAAGQHAAVWIEQFLLGRTLAG